MPGPALKALDDPADETDLLSAKAALDRIVIPEDTVDRIAQMVSPRSSLIVSDEGPSSETGRGTEFVIVMSDEPQGGLASQATGARYRRQVSISSRSALLALAVWKFVFLLVAAPALLIKSAPRIGRSNWQVRSIIDGRLIFGRASHAQIRSSASRQCVRHDLESRRGRSCGRGASPSRSANQRDALCFAAVAVRRSRRGAAALSQKSIFNLRQ